MEDKPIEQKESIKLTKNAKGDYQWEIKLLAQEDIPAELLVARLDAINKDLEKRFVKK